MSINQELRQHILRVPDFSLSKADAREIIRKYDFYCCGDDSTDKREYCNPQGEGIHQATSNAYAYYHDKDIAYDRLTGLFWQRSGSSSELSWPEAEAYVLDLSHSKYAGLEFWRLPNLAEAMSLVEPSGQNYDHLNPHLVPLHIHPVFDARQRWIWTSNGVGNGNPLETIWAVNFANGSCNPTEKRSPVYVRGVATAVNFPNDDQLEEIEQTDLSGSIGHEKLPRPTFLAQKCDFCKGTGRQACQMCGSSGNISRTYPSAYQTITMSVPCPACGGSGFIRCHKCHGLR